MEIHSFLSAMNRNLFDVFLEANLSIFVILCDKSGEQCDKMHATKQSEFLEVPFDFYDFNREFSTISVYLKKYKLVYSTVILKA